MDGESAWAIKPGATVWADEVEAEEVKKGATVDEEAFPTLGAALSNEPKKGKAAKKKGTKMDLNSFLNAPASRKSAVSDAEILMQLPKGSSGLSRDDPNALGGGFRDYGGDRQGGGFRDRGDREEREPSRADAVSDWGADRKFTPSESRGFGGGFGERRGGFGDRDRDRDGGGFGDRPRREDQPPSEADTADDWGANRKFVPAAAGDSKSFGGGFGRDRERPRSSFPDSSEPARGDAGDWGARRGPPSAEQSGPSGRRGYGFSEHPASQADVQDRWSHRAAAAEPPGRSAEQSAGERPRLKLAPRTKPLETPPPATNGVGPGSPAAAVSSPGGSGQQQVPAKPRSNPFGAAKPREEVLKEKGIDYRKQEMKLDHGEVIRDKTAEESELESEVEQLRKKLEGMKELTPGETDTIGDLEQELDDKEKVLYKMQAELDDQVRYSKHRPERERSTDSRGAASATAEDGPGFQEVRNPRSRSERPVGAAATSMDSPAGRGPPSEGAWGSGRGGFRDGPRGGGRGSSFRDMDNRDSRGSPAPRAGSGDRDRDREDRAPGRTAGGW